jgi:ankyrin repeat protein
MGLLLEHGANPDVQYGGFGPISHNAVYNDNAEVMELLLQRKADVHSRSTGGGKYTLLHWVTNAKLVPLLLAHGADINALNVDHETPLYAAAR